MDARNVAFDSEFLPIEIWEIIFSFPVVINLPAFFRIHRSVATLYKNIWKIHFKKHFPHLYEELPNKNLINWNRVFFIAASRSEYFDLSDTQRAVFIAVKENNLDIIKTIVRSESIISEDYGRNVDGTRFSAISLARKLGYQPILDYFFSIFTNDSEEVGEIYYFSIKKLKYAIYCRQPLEDIEALFQVMQALHGEYYGNNPSYGYGHIYLEMLSRAVKTGYVAFVALFLPGNRYASHCLAGQLECELREALFCEGMEVVNLLAHALGVSVEFENKDPLSLVKYAVNRKNHAILTHLLLTCPGVINDMLPILFATQDEEITRYVLTHPLANLASIHDAIQFEYSTSTNYCTSRDLWIIRCLLSIPTVPLNNLRAERILIQAFKIGSHYFHGSMQLLQRRNISSDELSRAIQSTIYYFGEVIDNDDLSRIWHDQKLAVEVIDSIILCDQFSAYHSFLSRMFSRFIEIGLCENPLVRIAILCAAIRLKIDPLVLTILALPNNDVNAVDKEGRSALIVAAQESNLFAVVTLLNVKDIDTTERDRYQFDALSIASQPAIRHLILLHQLKQRMLASQPSYLSQVTILNVNRVVDVPSHTQLLNAIDTLFSVISGQADTQSLNNIENILTSQTDLAAIYSEFKATQNLDLKKIPLSTGR